MNDHFIDGKKLDGKALAEELESILKEEVKVLKEKVERAPKIVSYYNASHEPSAMYTSMKYAVAEQVGIDFEAREYSLEEDLEYLEESIMEANEDSSIDGIMLQLPAPGELGKAVEKIAPQKDVDGLTEEGRKIFLPATVRGVKVLLERSINGWKDKKIAVMGSTGLIGGEILEMLRKEGVQNAEGLSRSMDKGDYAAILKNADILISATGYEDQIDPSSVKEGFVFINVGLARPQDELKEKASIYTPRFGGTGPLTVWALMENVVDAFGDK